MTNGASENRPLVILAGSDPYYLIRFRRDLIIQLIENGYNVTTISWPCTDEVYQEIISMGVTEHLSAPIRQGTLNPFHEIWLTLSLVKIFATRRPDILIAYTAKPVVSGMIAAFVAGVRSRIALVEGMGFSFTKGDEGTRQIAKLFLTLGYAISLRMSSKIVVLNPSDIVDVAKLSGRNHGDISIVRGIGVSESYYRKSSFPSGPIRFIYVGRILFDKGIREIIGACRQLRSEGQTFQMTFVGAHDSNPASFPELEFRRELEAIDAEWVGPSEDVTGEISRSHVLLLPSYREGFPRVVMEAMAGSRPVIVSDVPGCRDSIISDVTGLLVRPFDSGSLADAMRVLLERPELVESMGLSAYEYARQHFDATERSLELMSKVGLKVKT